MFLRPLNIFLLIIMLLGASGGTWAQTSTNDTIRLGAADIDGHIYPYVFLPEFTKVALMLNDEDRKRINILRSQVYATYSYALTAAAIFKSINAELEQQPNRRARKHVLKNIDKQLDVAFKQPLKNLSIDQGHVLIKLINRQTGDNCYHIIKELKGGFSAVMWQSVGVFFNNNLARDYDPQGKDKELESIVQELESSAAYRYQLYLQDEMMRRIGQK